MVRSPGACLLPLAFALVLAAGLAQGTEIVSKGNPAPANHISGVPTVAPISADGRFIAFVSLASNIVSGQTDGTLTADVFLYDVDSGTTVLVSHTPSSTTTTVNAASAGPVISADGNYVAFFSSSGVLVSGQSDANGTYDLFLYSRQDGTVTLVSHASGSPLTAGNGASSGAFFDSSLSSDGRYVAFESVASNLVAGQTDFNSAPDVFLYDRTTGTSVLVSRASGSTTTTGNGTSKEPRISTDGRYVVFRSTATNLVAGQTDANGGDDVFLFDRDTGTLTLVSHAQGSAVTAGNGTSQNPRISADGNYAAFTSAATNLVFGQTDPIASSSDVFLYQRASGGVALVSRSAASVTTVGNGSSNAPDLSADGRFVAFSSIATNLVAGQADTNGSLDVFLYDRTSLTTTLVSHAASSSTTTGQSWSQEPRISVDGSRIAFRSNAGNLIPGQTGSSGSNGNIFFWDRLTGVIGLASGSLGSATKTSNSDSYSQTPDADGSHIAFSSLSTDLVAGDTNRFQDVFLYAPFKPADFYTVTPCRLLDTRDPQDGPALTSGAVATVIVHGSCGIPATATSVSLNVTAVQATGSGQLTLFPGDQGQPPTSTIHYAAGQTRANNAILPLASDGAGTLKIAPFVEGGGTVHVILDVNGYFEPEAPTFFQ
ncbi:MAG TPA: hypothetical protein VF756_05300 [Thermoanaerobaculia bacterium]